MDELLAELATLAPDLTSEASALELQLAEQTAEAVRAAYPVVTGALRASVQVERQSSTSPARVFTRVIVTAPYAEFHEFGTSRTAPNPTFIPITRRGREAFVGAVVAKVKARGLDVTGSA